MMNDKGFTILEVMITLTLTSIILLTALYIPAELVRDHTGYSAFSDETSEVYTLRKTIAEDIKEGVLKETEAGVAIGNNMYSFGDRVKRNSVFLTRNPFQYEINNNTLKVYNDNLSFEYTANSSFNKNKDGDGNEQ